MLMLSLLLAACCRVALAPGCHQIPYFNAPIFLENKTQIGKVDEILGSINSVVSDLWASGARGGLQDEGPPSAPLPLDMPQHWFSFQVAACAA